MKKREISLQQVKMNAQIELHPMTKIWRFEYRQGKHEVFHAYFKASREAISLVFADLQTRFYCDAVMKYVQFTVAESAVNGVLATIYDSCEEFMLATL